MIRYFKQKLAPALLALSMMGSASFAQTLSPFIPTQRGSDAYKAVQGEMFRIPQGGVAQIDRHGQCRRVKNNQSENPVMIPVAGPGQWSTGTNSFLLSDTVATLVGPCYVFQIVWLLDASGSMMSRKMSRAQDLIIDALTEASDSTIPYPYLKNAAPVAGDYLYSFNDNAYNRGGARRGDAAAVNELKNRIRSVSGNGNTDIPRALRQVFAAAAAGGMNTGINKTILTSSTP